jgi:hypothetical protein
MLSQADNAWLNATSAPGTRPGAPNKPSAALVLALLDKQRQETQSRAAKVSEAICDAVAQYRDSCENSKFHQLNHVAIYDSANVDIFYPEHERSKALNKFSTLLTYNTNVARSKPWPFTKVRVPPPTRTH